MLFNSLNFIIFFVAVVVIYYVLPKNSWRKVFLLGASYYFYACFNVAMLSVLLFEIALAHWCGLSKNKTKTSLAATIILLLLPLLCFKYLNFLMGTLGDVLALGGALIEMPSFARLSKLRDNLAERTIRKMTTQRNSMLHFGSDERVEMAAAYHSVISTVKLHDMSSWHFLGEFFQKVFSGCRDFLSMNPIAYRVGML